MLTFFVTILSFQNIWVGSGIRDPRSGIQKKTYPGSGIRGQQSTGSGSATLFSSYFFCIWSAMQADMVRIIVERTNEKIEEDFIKKAYSAETLAKSPHIAHVDEVVIFERDCVTRWKLFQKAYNSRSEPLHFVSSLIVGLNCKEYFFS